ncbi:MAG: RNA polymerase sigma factor [Desulfuromonadales bacterium]|nr:RNA polymerase sigma factor [Desulfuromonadales bacterium]
MDADAQQALLIDTAPAGRYAQGMMMTPEQTLVQRILAGDETGFEQLVRQESSRTLSLAWRLVGNRHEAEELVQEAFLRLYKSLPKFRGESRISTWLYRTTTRLAIDHLRRERLKRKLFFMRASEDDVDPVDLASDPRDNPHRELQARQTIAALRRSLSRLSPRQQVIFTLRHYEGLSLQEIADHLDLQLGTVKIHLHRAVTHLRRELADDYEVVP